MKPEFEKIQKKPTNSFTARLVKRTNRPLLSKAWHYHPEIEICYTTKSSGRRYVGNNISDYDQRDLVILGSNLPHGFTTIDECEQFVIQFSREFLGKEFFKLAELSRINALLERCKRGLLLSGAEIDGADKRIKKLYKQDQSSLNLLLSLIELLDYLSLCNGFTPICTKKYGSHISIKKLNRIKTIFDYIESNFQKELNVLGACKVVNMTEAAFYKFIKRHTNKKFTTIVNEYRMDHATKLLVSGNLAISEISYQSGYSNLSHFNRKFKQIYNMTPRQFRSKYQ